MRVGRPLKDVRQTVLYFSDDLYHYYMENFQTIDTRLTFVNAAATSVQHTRMLVSRARRVQRPHGYSGIRHFWHCRNTHTYINTLNDYKL